MLIAARSSQDFACCLRATASARSKYTSAFWVEYLEGNSRRSQLAMTAGDCGGCRKHRDKGKGTTRYPDQYLYETLRLVRLPGLTRDLPWAKA
jgi:hypothetical protein